MYVNIRIYNVEQRRINVVYFNVDLNNIKQRRNSVVIFNVVFHNVGQRRNNVVNMTIYLFELQRKIIWIEYNGLKIFFTLFPILTGICRRTFAKSQKFLKHREYT